MQKSSLSIIGIGLGIFTLLFGLQFLANRSLQPENFKQENGQIVQVEENTQETQNTSAPSIIAQNLVVPWEITKLPNGDLLVTQRTGELLKIASETKVVSIISGVEAVGEGGLLGLALDPNFSQNNYIYLYLTVEQNGAIANRVERYKYTGDNVTDKQIILEDIKGASNHDGGRIAFGPDNLLYIATGDAEDEDLAQDTNSLNGKILRINADGTIPSDNPFGNAVYSYGHRNPQGLAWDSSGRLWSTEHGPSGLQSGNDELNLIVKGGNYGWPNFVGMQTGSSIIIPVLESGSDSTWAPSGMTIVDDVIYFSGLRGEAIYSAKINNNTVTDFKSHFENEFGRLRAVTKSSDKEILVSTSNTDGRGNPNEDDDKILLLTLPLD